MMYTTSDILDFPEIIKAVVDSNYTLIDKLLDSDMSLINSVDRHNNGLLFFATGSKNYEMVEYLLKRGADPDPVEDLETKWCVNIAPVKHAAIYDCHKSVDLLLSHGAEPNNISYGGWSLLWHAIENENVEMFNIMISHGCDINLGGELGTPINHALFLESAEMVNLCLENGADTSHILKNKKKHYKKMLKKKLIKKHIA